MHLEILLEERSMENVISAIIPQIAGVGSRHTFQTHPHNGKQHLLKQLPNKLRAYSQWLHHAYQEYCIVIILDQDRDDCRALKQVIMEWAVRADLNENVLVRIAVTELESWFLGDPDALMAALPRLRIRGKPIYRQPDRRPDPSNDLDHEMKKAGYKGYFKVAHSEAIGKYSSLRDNHNRSHSFNVTLSALRSLLSDDPEQPYPFQDWNK
jgi:hypothetical protein